MKNKSFNFAELGRERDSHALIAFELQTKLEHQVAPLEVGEDWSQSVHRLHPVLHPYDLCRNLWWTTQRLLYVLVPHQLQREFLHLSRC